jgi:hypothetical protein
LLTQRTWEDFHALVGGQTRIIDNERQLFATRMMHISEVMSLGIRLNASWGLTHAAMSLMRDRYEQTVRFSRLARKSGAEEIKKYMRYFYAKARLLMRETSVRQDYEKRLGELPQWVTEKLQKNRMTKCENGNLSISARWRSVAIRCRH